MNIILKHKKADLMWSKFAKNSILVGQVDAYCLACECYLRSEESTTLHIDKPVHTNNLIAVGYFEKFKDDHIRKVKSGYFCGMCNELLATAARAGLHVRELPHRDNRAAVLLRRPTGGGGVLAHDAVLLAEDAWHGLVDDTCVLCNAEFEAKDIHKSEHTHILKLVQNKVILGAQKSVYRKIDESSYHCLTCNNVFSAATFDEHFDSTDHKTAHKLCEITDENSVANDATDKKITADRPIECKHNGDFKPSNGIKQNGDVKESQKTTMGVDLDDVYCETLGAKNYILDLDNSIGSFCILCHCNVPTLEPIKTHLESKHHQTMLKLHKEYVENNKIVKDSEEAAKTQRDSEKAAKTKRDSDEAAKTKTDSDKAAKTKRDTEISAKNKRDTEKAAKTKKESEHDGKSQEMCANITENRSLILDSVSIFQKNDVNINFINDAAFCKKCTVNVDFDFNAINKHINDHKKTANKNDDKKVPFEHGVQANGDNKNLYTKPVFTTSNEASISATSIEDIKALAKKNGMMYNGRELHCTMCDSSVTVSVKNIEEHISGSKHKAKVTQVVVKQTPKKKITKQLMEKFIKDLTMIEDDDTGVIMINEKICINTFIFMFLGRTVLSEIICIACKLKLTSMEMLTHHIQGPRHKKMMLECQVITSLDSEFVREIRPGGYHCGFCNDLLDDWEDLEEHLDSSDHKRSKTRAEWRVQELITDVRAHKVRKQMEFEMFARMFMSNNMFMRNMFNFGNPDSDSD